MAKIPQSPKCDHVSTPFSNASKGALISMLLAITPDNALILEGKHLVLHSQWF